MPDERRRACRAQHRTTRIRRDVVVAVEAVLCVQQRLGTAAHATMPPLHLLLHTCAPARLLCLQMALASAFVYVFWLDIACICPPYIAA